MATLREVGVCQSNGKEASFGPLVCYVANFSSQYPRPRQFTYRGCTFVAYRDVICGKSIEGRSEQCEHNPLAEGNHTYLYRFDVFLFDANHGGEPVKACIYDAARKLLDMAPDEFQRMEQDRQVAMLHSVTTGMPIVNVMLRTTADKKVIVQKLEKVILINSPDERESFKTARSASRTPHASSSSVASKVSKSKSKLKFGGLDVGVVKRQLESTMEMLAALQTRDDEDSE